MAFVVFFRFSHSTVIKFRAVLTVTVSRLFTCEKSAFF